MFLLIYNDCLENTLQILGFIHLFFYFFIIKGSLGFITRGNNACLLPVGIWGDECGECNQNSAIFVSTICNVSEGIAWRQRCLPYHLWLMTGSQWCLKKSSTLPKADFTDLYIITKRKIFLMLCHQKGKYLFVLKLMSTFRDDFYLWINILKQYLNQSKIKPWTSIYINAILMALW